jgi:hypothetical protein
MAVRDQISVNILGLVCFKGDLIQCTPLKGDVQERVASTIFGVILGTDNKLELQAGGFYRQRKKIQIPLSACPSECTRLVSLLGCDDASVEFGYYGHRFIFTVTFPRMADDYKFQGFAKLRERVTDFHQAIAAKLELAGNASSTESKKAVFSNCDLTEDKWPIPPAGKDSLLSNQGIMHVYTYPFVVLPNAVSRLEYDLIDGPGQKRREVDHIFTDRNTTFGTFLREYEPARLGHEGFWKSLWRCLVDIPFLVLFRRHYAKMSTSGTWLLLDGWGIGEELLDDLIDAIFVGGLHENAMIDYAREKEYCKEQSKLNPERKSREDNPKDKTVTPESGTRDCSCPALSYRRTNGWTYELLSKVYDLTHKFVQARDQDRLRALLAVFGFMITFGAVVFRAAIEKGGCIAVLALVLLLLAGMVLGLVWNIRFLEAIRFRYFRRHLLALLLVGLPLTMTGIWAVNPSNQKCMTCVVQKVTAGEWRAVWECSMPDGEQTSIANSVTNVTIDNDVDKEKPVQPRPPKPPKDSSTVSTCPKPLLPSTDSNIAK